MENTGNNSSIYNFYNLTELAAESEASNNVNMLMERNIPDDVGEGVKALMTLWNRHLNEFGTVAFCQMPRIVEMFLKSHGREIIRKDLYRHFVSHMSALVCNHLVSREVFDGVLGKLMEIMKGDINDDEQFNQFVGLTTSTEKVIRKKERKSTTPSTDPDQPTTSTGIAHRTGSCPPRKVKKTMNYKC